ncbi:hypothetical protein NDU88_001373 [Pleurodeles waltl]|uniref:Uncharacterized protein n=1 Tax=Pleurodeles waltl TaxID=8319 RepID=A0AAV7UTV1_PLEWA|nr:hypothetical protein NDU88_001373 [Pleurodeles waltl]
MGQVLGRLSHRLGKRRGNETARSALNSIQGRDSQCKQARPYATGSAESFGVRRIVQAACPTVWEEDAVKKRRAALSIVFKAGIHSASGPGRMPPVPLKVLEFGVSCR